MENGNKIDIQYMKFTNDLVKPNISKDKNGLIKWGGDNLYPDYLLEVYLNKSSIHKKIIDRKSLMTSGNGISYNEDNSDLKKFMRNLNSETGDIEEIMKMITPDLYLFSGFALAIKWTQNGTKIASIDYVPFHKCRVMEDGSISVANDWSRKGIRENEPVNYPKFSLTERKKEIQIFYYVTPGPGVDYYPNIDYCPAITAIETEGRIDNFHYNNSKNSFGGSYIIVFKNGKPTLEERAYVSQQFEEQYQGDENGGKVVYMFANSEDEVPEFIPMDNTGNDELYISLDKRINAKILASHGITAPQLFGILDEGMTFRSKGELQESLEVYQDLEITPIQNTLEKIFNKFLAINDIDEEITLNTYKIKEESNEL